MPEDDRIVVVGSGPTGAAAAVFLTRAGANVLLLEAGARRLALGLTVRARGMTVLRLRRPLKTRVGVAPTADPHAVLYEDLAPGGLTNHWSCAVPRFSEDDFADATRAGEPFAWPIAYGDLAPWYDRVEPLLRISGSASSTPQVPAGRVYRERSLAKEWRAVEESARQRGRSLLPTPYVYGDETTITPSGTVFNSFVRLIEPVQRASRLAVKFGARVVRLEWSAKSKRVDAVVVADSGGSESRIPCRAVVLAASAIGTTEILLRSSNPDFPAGLGDTHGVLGHYLHDHPLGKLIVDLGGSLPINPPAYLTRPVLDRAKPLYAASCLQWTGVELLVRSVLRGEPGRVHSLGFNVFGTMAPRHDNWVALGTAKHDGRGETGLNLHIEAPGEARATLEQTRDDLVDIFAGAGLKPKVRLWYVAPMGDAKHFGGTARMHASPRFGVLDGYNRLHAVRNVAVVDSSAFTTGPEKNPVLTAMALAARAADRLAAEVRAGDL